MFRGSVKGTGYPLHSPVPPSFPVPCVTVCHHISTGVYLSPVLCTVNVFLSYDHLSKSTAYTKVTSALNFVYTHAHTHTHTHTGVCYNDRMLQRTVFINGIRMLQRTRRNTIGRGSTCVHISVRLFMLFITENFFIVFTKEKLFMLFPTHVQRIKDK